MSDTRVKVAVLGLGIMGGGMAGQLIAKGFDVTVWNRDPAKAPPLGEAGATVADSPAEAAIRDPRAAMKEGGAIRQAFARRLDEKREVSVAVSAKKGVNVNRALVVCVITFG